MNDIAVGFAVVPALSTFVWAFLILGLFPVVLTAGAAWLLSRKISPTLIAIVSVVGGVMFAASLTVLLRNDISLTGQSLSVQAGFYRRSVDKVDIVWTDARLIDAAAVPELTPRVRTNGIDLPGYQAGWFILKNGTRAFLLVTGKTRLYLPTAKGDALVLSVEPQSPLFQALEREYGIRMD